MGETLRSSAADSRKLEAFYARKSRTPNCGLSLQGFARQGAFVAHPEQQRLPDAQRRIAEERVPTSRNGIG